MIAQAAPRVVVPYTRLHPTTAQVLNSYGLPVDYVAMLDDQHYSRLLGRLWQQRQMVVIVEHDIVPWPGAIEELEACPAIWCTCSYVWTNPHGEAGIGLSHMLGCAKLSHWLMEATPNVWLGGCHWAECDRRLFAAARDVGIEPHLHRPPVIHLKAAA